MTSCSPEDLVANSLCYQCIPKGMRESVITYLLCQLANSGGGGTCAALSGADNPTGLVTPQFIGQLYHNTTDDTYWRSTGLTSADWTAISGGASTALVIPAAGSGGLSLYTDSVTTTLTCPNLVSVGGSVGVYLTTFTVLTSASFPVLGLVSGGSLEIDNDAGANLLLASISAPNLVTVTNNISCANNPSLTTIDWSSWLPTDGTTITFAGCALTAASVELILSRCVASSVTTCTIDLSGGTNAGLTSLSAQGQTDAATLGAQLTINP